MTIELLDTDTEQGGEMAEVERWSEYVDKYLCIGDNISDELKQQLARKPVFLSRFVSSPPPLPQFFGHHEISDNSVVCFVCVLIGIHSASTKLFFKGQCNFFLVVACNLCVLVYYMSGNGCLYFARHVAVT